MFSQPGIRRERRAEGMRFRRLAETRSPGRV